MKTIKRKIVQEGMNKEETMMEDDSVVIKKIQKITGGAILPLSNGKEYVVVFSKVDPTKLIVFNVESNQIYLSGSGFDSELSYVDSKSNPITLETVRLITNLL
ncbi:hypothetical protein Koombakaat1_00069 [Staphylococcus phage Koomba-kaat_1]|nr:hypothetical protein Koombakaat1_00069 [Staphylococcus phage Koomba-kaat_1]